MIMANLSKIKREKMLEYLENLKELKNDDEHIKETLFELKDLLCTKIRKAHETGRGSYPVINFSEIYTIIISIQKREKRAIHTARNMLESKILISKILMLL